MLRNLIPPVPEQYAIIEHIARETAKLDAVWVRLSAPSRYLRSAVPRSSPPR